MGRREAHDVPDAAQRNHQREKLGREAVAVHPLEEQTRNELARSFDLIDGYGGNIRDIHEEEEGGHETEGEETGEARGAGGSAWGADLA